MTEPVGAPDAGMYFEHTPSLLADADNAALLASPLAGDVTTLYVLNSLDARMDSRAQMDDIQKANEARRVALERQQAALEAAREAEDDGGFWGSLSGTLGTVAKVAGCVAAVGFAVATGGAGTPVAALAIAGAVASSASLAQSELGVFDDLLGEEVADRVGSGLAIAGAAGCLGAGVLTWFGAAASTPNALTQGAAVVGAGAGVAAGGAAAAEAYYLREAGHHEADATRAWLSAQMQQFLIEQLIEDLSQTKERETANVKRIVSMNQTNDAALGAAARGVA